MNSRKSIMHSIGHRNFLPIWKESSLSYTKVLSYTTDKTHFEESLTTAVYLSQDKVVSWFVKSAHR